MKRSLSIFIAAALLVANLQATRAQQNTAQAEKQLASAQRKATLDGDLKGAIDEYRKIVAGAGANRALAAQALVRMAECYQKLGDSEARRIYQQILREYADQKDMVALARTRLGSNEPGRMTSRSVASVPVGGIGYGTVSSDGRYFPFTNWDNGDLYLRDLATGADRRLTSASALDSRPSQFAGQATFSKDGRQLAYSWFVDRSTEIRVVDPAADNPSPRRLFSNEDVSQIWPDDWSPDGRWVAVQVRRQDKTAQIGVLTVQDGSFRALKSVDWRGATRLMFSPDGKYLAYDLPRSDTDNQRDVFIVAVDGSQEVGAVVHPANDVVMGWSPDGSALLFSSDRTGSVGLWQVRIAEGRPQGQAELVKPNVEGATLGVTRSGALYSLVHPPRFNAVVSANIQIRTFDFEAQRFASAPVMPVQRFVGTNSFPVWSPDGKSLAYVSLREGATEPAAPRSAVIVGIHSVETGEIRELRPALNLSPAVLRWSADGLSLIAAGRDVKGRQGLYRIDARTGTVSDIVRSTDDGELRSPVESPDGTNLYYFRGYVGQPEREFALIERSLTSGSEREVIRRRNFFALASVAVLSPDGQSIIVSTEDSAAKTSALLVVPVHGGQPKEIMRVDHPLMVRIQSWMPNSRGILAVVSSTWPGQGAGRGAELWHVPLDGGERRKLDLNVTGMTPFSIHPDSRQIAYGLTEQAKNDEVWVLEHFLPTRPTK
jgi:Tol biopolymer transport system component